jgi:hypothetical protein
VRANSQGMHIALNRALRAVLDVAKVKTVLPDPADAANRLVLLGAADEGGQSTPLAMEVTDRRQPAELNGEARDFLAKEGAQFTTCPVVLDYDYWTAGAGRCFPL